MSISKSFSAGQPKIIACCSGGCSALQRWLAKYMKPLVEVTDLIKHNVSSIVTMIFVSNETILKYYPSAGSDEVARCGTAWELA